MTMRRRYRACIVIPNRPSVVLAICLAVCCTFFSFHSLWPQTGGAFVLAGEANTSSPVRSRQEKDVKTDAAQPSSLNTARQLIDGFNASSGPVGQAIKNAYGARMAEFAKLVHTGNDPDRVAKHLEYLLVQISPWLASDLELLSGKDGVEMIVRCTSSQARPGMTAEFPLNFPIFEQLAQRPLKHDSCTVYAITPEGERPVTANYEAMTPQRGKLVWNLVERADRYRLRFAADTSSTAPFRRLLGNGDHLMLNETAKRSLPSNFWNVQLNKNLFDDKTPALLAGRWTDFAHLYRNVGRPGDFHFSENEHYLLRDPFDEPIGTSDHHGLAFSLVECLDGDGDGKSDFFLSRFFNPVPLFVRSVSRQPADLDFSEPVPLASLPGGWRYSFGDLDGDRIADAIAARRNNNATEVRYHHGLGLDAKGVPAFSAPVSPGVVFPDSTEPQRGTTERYVSAALADLDGDGLLDLSVCVPPRIFVSFNRGNKTRYRFTPPEPVRYEDGREFYNDFYYPNHSWGDVNGDGIPDLFTRTANRIHLSKNTVLKVADRPLANGQWLEKQVSLSDVYNGLGSFDIVDLDGDGHLEFCQVDHEMRLTRYRFVDGLFTRLPPIPLEPKGTQRFGCPDTNEYGALYTQVRIADLDGDGRPDILTNSEHNWRFGYFSFYRNLGNDRFAPEEQLSPKRYDGHLELARSTTGPALAVRSQTNLDYLSFESKGRLDPKGGAVEFQFASDRDGVPGIGRTLFSSGFWNKHQFTAPRLREDYLKNKTLASFLDDQTPFALVQLPDGRLRLQAGKLSAESDVPVVLAQKERHRFRVVWTEKRTSLEFDGRPLVAIESGPVFADRFHPGSMAWMAVQYAREYPDRRKGHPTDFSTPAEGCFDSFRIKDSAGNTTFGPEWDAESSPVRNRSALVYRCAPGVTENYFGKPALIAHFDDPRRTQMPGMKARLYAVPFEKKPGSAPQFGRPVGLDFVDGSPFYAHSRTVVVLKDWNRDGWPDIILSTENYRNDYNIGIELFINDGKWNFRRTSDPEIVRLNELITAHHDIKLGFAPLTGAGKDDLVVWTDPGIRVYSRAFLTQPKLRFSLEKFYR